MSKDCLAPAVPATTWAMVLFVLAGPCVPAAGAADQSIRGGVVIVKDPRSDDPSRRQVVARAREPASALSDHDPVAVRFGWAVE